MDAEKIRSAIRRTYERRSANDLEGSIAIFGPDAVFRLAERDGGVHRADEMRSGLKKLFETFHAVSFHSTFLIVEGNKAAAIVDGEFRFIATGETFRTQLAHFWTFEGSHAVELVEFRDTALIAALSGQSAAAAEPA